ncbi:unnamed protein product [Pedinophyceae sp. YPF-701]|nr:unnamed protein product [Pedinophyceae sp. YPF-701]
MTRDVKKDDSEWGVDTEKVAGTLRSRMQEQGVQLAPGILINEDEDATLHRFLRARKYDVDATLKMLKDTLKWREQLNVDDKLASGYDVVKLKTIRENRPATYVGWDRTGQPVYVDRIGILNQPAMEKAGITSDDVVEFHIREMEFFTKHMLKDSSKKAGNTIETCCSVIDVTGLKLSMFTKQVKELFAAISKVDSDNYPETLGRVYVFGAGVVFQTIWKVLKIFLDARTASKIKVMGSGKKALAELHAAIEPDVLPDFLGGSVDFEYLRRKWAKVIDDAMRKEARAKGTGWPSAEEDAMLHEFYGDVQLSPRQSLDDQPVSPRTRQSLESHKSKGLSLKRVFSKKERKPVHLGTPPPYDGVSAAVSQALGRADLLIEYLNTHHS